MKKIFFVILFFTTVLTFSQGQLNREVDSLKGLLKKEVQDEKRIFLLYTLATKLMRSDTIISTNYALEALNLSKKIGYKEGEIDVLEFFSRKFTEQGRLDTALQILNTILQQEDQIENKQRVANLYISKGNIYDIKSDYTRALDAYLKGEEYFLQANNDRGVGMANLGIGNIYHATERWDQALDRYRKSAKFLQKINDPYASWPINNMATSMQNIGQLDSAEYYFQISLKMKEDAGDIYGASYTYSDMAELYVLMNQIDLAEKYLKKALELKLQVEGISQETIGMALIRLGEIQIKRGKFIESIPNLRMGLEKAEESASVEAIMFGNKHLSNALYKIGNYKEAYEKLFMFSSLQDSISKVKSSQALAEMQTKYETKEKDEQLQSANRANELNKLRAYKAEADSERKNTLIYGALALVLLLLLGVGFAIRSIQLRKRNNEILRSKNKEITIQKEIVEEKNKEITDSITYAKRIQSAILPSDNLIKRSLPNSFVLYKPKDIVAGDFYWMEMGKSIAQEQENVLIAAADCTGHGVPGAMVSVVCNNSLNRSVREFGLTDPGKILDKTRELVVKEFEKSQEEVKDGMDIAVVSIEQQQGEGASSKSISCSKLKYAGANNPLWVIRKDSNEIEEFKADKQPIGKFSHSKPFVTHELTLNSGDTFYIFSDGYVDQFGGDKGKKFKASNLKTLLLDIQNLEMSTQKEQLDQVFEEWKGENEQLDDVCFIGVRI
ncbi:MAG: SpoIIE family protein phosphatase [Crocinitomicaceae bacterium]|nr:SpoIIE family protein phosphatase [Crocinitomicaceae bacterium]